MKLFCSGLRASLPARAIETSAAVGSQAREPFSWLAKASGLLLTLAMVACGGGGGGDTTANESAPPPPATYTIGGTVSGLTGSGLTLQNNGGNNLSVAANATSFTFSSAVSSGTAYAVTVSAQPSGQTCTVSNGSGTATANVTNVAVSCKAAAASTFTIGGAVTGLTGAGLVLQDNGGDSLP